MALEIKNLLSKKMPFSGRFSFVRSVRSDQSVLKQNARVFRTGSGQNPPAHGSELLSSPAPVGQSAGSSFGELWREKIYARALDLSIYKTGQNKIFSAVRTDRNGKRTKASRASSVIVIGDRIFKKKKKKRFNKRWVNTKVYLTPDRKQIGSV